MKRSPPPSADPGQLYRKIPQLDDTVRRAEFKAYRRELVVAAARSALAAMRNSIAAGKHTEESLQREIDKLSATILSDLRAGIQYSLRPVINATGVILHTNLGRAPLGETALRHVLEVAEGYCNLEIELTSGERSRRDAHVEPLLLRLLAIETGQQPEAFARSHRAVVVNNCAAATFLALNSLADGGEVITSRGELVEIGGGFRIPDILRKSGAVLREVGTTNRTRTADYEAARTPNTKLILRVHPSNFAMQGFTERPSLASLVALSASSGVPLFEDQGTGCLVDLTEYQVPHESSLIASVREGPDLIAASGDKLMGGPQCGVLLGKKHLIETILANPLLRAFRVDKLTCAALEGTLVAYLAGKRQEIPALRMMSEKPDKILARCQALAAAVNGDTLHAEVVPVQSVIGGGTTPRASLDSFAVSLRHGMLAAAALAATLRTLETPVVARIREEWVLLDLRTVPVAMDSLLERLLKGVTEHSLPVPWRDRNGVRA